MTSEPPPAIPADPGVTHRATLCVGPTSQVVWCSGLPANGLKDPSEGNDEDPEGTGRAAAPTHLTGREIRAGRGSRGWGLTVHMSPIWWGGTRKPDSGLCHGTTCRPGVSRVQPPARDPVSLQARRWGPALHAVSGCLYPPCRLPSWPGTSETRTPSLPQASLASPAGQGQGGSEGLSIRGGVAGPFLPAQPCRHSPPPPHCSCSGKGISPP